MANTFKNSRAAMTTGGVTAYTCPAATTAIVIGCIIANVDGTNAANATVTWTDNSGSTTTNLIKLVSIPPNSSLAVIGGANGKLVLEASDLITATASADSDLEITVSVLEIT